jgi:hypothetical protein
MANKGIKQTARSRGRKKMTARRKGSQPRSFFKREAEWMWLMNLAPFGIGLVLALIFWFTR